MTDPGVSTTRREQFHDPIRREMVTLVIPFGGRIHPSQGDPKIGVEHPGCAELADLSVDLDAFYCRHLPVERPGLRRLGRRPDQGSSASRGGRHMTAAEVATYNRPLADDEVAYVDCDGTGEVERWVQCGRCKGFGSVPSATGER